MRLKILLPAILSDGETLRTLIANLEGQQITTAEDLILYYSVDQLLEILPPNLMTKKQLVQLYADIGASLVPEPVLGHELLAQEEARLHSVGSAPKFGLASIDPLLLFPSYGVVEIAGLTKTGKTLLVTHLITRHLSIHQDATATWIDTKGSFSPERTSQVAEHFASPENGVKDDDVLSRLHIVVNLDLPAIYDTLEAISSQTTEDSHPHTRFVVIDCITPILSSILSSGSAKGHALMDSFMLHLNSLCKNHGLLILVVNTAARIPTPQVPVGKTPPKPTFKPSLGPSFTYLSDMSLYLKRIEPVSGAQAKKSFAIKVLKSRTSVSTNEDLDIL